MSATSDLPSDWMKLSTVRGAVTLIVGAGSGMGEAAARIFAANDARVMVADLNEGRATAVANSIRAGGGVASSRRVDVADPADIQALVAATVAAFGGIDILINTSAYVKPAPLETAPQDEWRRSFSVNVSGALQLAQACLVHLKKSARAAIVLTSSIGALHSFPRGAAYGPSKAALVTLGRQMALEWARFGIRVNVVLPGTIDTPMARAAQSPEIRTVREATIPMKRLGDPEEVANLMLFLASPAASYVTAEAFCCDGGLTQTLFMATFSGGAMAAGERREPMRAASDWMSRTPINGLSALVVGGGGAGIGAMTARTIATNGAAVVIVDLDGEAARKVADEIVADGGRAIGLGGNVASASDMAAAIRAAADSFGGLDLLVNSAALVKPQPLDLVSLEDWDACFEVNVESALNIARLSLPELRKSRAASIVNVGSLGGVWGRPNGGAYGPSKAALMTLSTQLALEWADYGIRVNAVTPGTIDTPLARAAVPADVLTERVREIPLGRLGTPQEMANMIVYLLSPAASYITGQVFNCDGGHANSMFLAPMAATAPGA